MEFGALAAYLVLLVWIGLRASSKIKNTLDYTVAGRDVAWIVVLATTAATMVGGGASIGSVSSVYQDGLVFALVTCAWHVQLIVTGLWIAPRLRQLNLLTVAEFFGKRFGEPARLMAIVSCMIFLVGALVAQMVAMGTITETILGIDYRLAVLGGAAIVIFYSTIGGIRAVVKTDVLQFVVLVAGIGAASVFLLMENEGFSGLLAKAGEAPFQFTTPEWPAMRVITLFCAFFLGEMLVPPYAVRCFIARNPQGARWGVAGSGIFLLCFLPVAIFIMGVSAQVHPDVQQAVEQKKKEIAAADPNLTEKEIAEEASQIVFPTLMRATFPAAIAGIMIAALIAAVMSSGDSCLSCISTIVMEDIYRKLIDPAASDRRLLRVAQMATLVTGVIAAACSFVYRDIVGILEFVYDFWAPTMVCPFLVGLFLYRKNQSYAATLCMLSGFISVGIWRFWLGTPGGFSPALFGFLVSVIVFPVALLLTHRRPNSELFEPQQEDLP
jgi:SSS family solute:Na+ symporter